MSVATGKCSRLLSSVEGKLATYGLYDLHFVGNGAMLYSRWPGSI